MTAAVAAAVIFFLLATLPPRSANTYAGTLEAGILNRTIAGAFHVHTTRSDGAADRAHVASAARDAGLQFVIFADHGDGTRTPDPPAYVSGVLCVDGVEISTNGGHYVALGLPATPYPLGGQAAAVLEDVARLGGFGFAAHPDSARAELAWADETLLIDGLEWLNADSEWRDEHGVQLSRLLFDYALRPGPAMASMLDRPVATLARWDAMTATRPVVAIGGHDAHGGIGTRLENGRWSSLGIPSYGASFRSFSVRVVLPEPPRGDSAYDARLLLEAIRGGRVFTAIDAVAAPAGLDFRARRGGEQVVMGGRLRPGGTAHFMARAAVPERARLVLFHNGEELHAADGGSLDFEATPAEGAYRIEIHVPDAPGNPQVPWLLSNPIYFLPQGSEPPVRSRALPQTVSRVGKWRIEKDALSIGSLSLSDSAVRLDFKLHGDGRDSQFVALAAGLARPGGAFRRIDFNASADRPMRISVQLRYPDRRGHRWAHSVYVDREVTPMSVAVEEMMPADGQVGSPPDTALADSLLFVVDLTNAPPGAAGRLEVRNLSLVR